ncbi:MULTISPECIES: urease accessory protein UreE [Paraburkholderia]|jgi:urease accessory protein|uniref:urease accessory protein UreE n=1 Tax=Paraburkholderia TaxID=1822464 RepID=UPI001B2A4C60|nr:MULTISPECIES: urease accessory protein UreE [Paraburkholderia]MCP2085016.1 urease accessory protein [Paraburkholderia sediminicola]MCX4141681.1 urease accessory protein UreE [Paraburkholderia aspalathi]MCX4157732.1 urease accessory protein UreE [Paraburkholderia aspalathi]MDN7167134.1 urease accessory protein UreE [Paraburkholderia sp. SECH2]MDN7174361.1 urease accessory protein UreE [Paraburkholderia sp. SEWSISQ10-3 4]
MITYTSIIGSAAEPRIADLLHSLEHHGRVDYVTLAADDIKRHRLRARTQRGDECGIALDRDMHLFDGAVLRLDRDAALVVRTEDTRWLRLAPRDAAAALELGYFAGNMHWKVRFDRGALEIAVKGALDDYLQRLAPMLADQRIRLANDVSDGREHHHV